MEIPLPIYSLQNNKYHRFINKVKGTLFKFTKMKPNPLRCEVWYYILVSAVSFQLVSPLLTSETPKHAVGAIGRKDLDY